MTNISFATVDHCRQRLTQALADLETAVTCWRNDIDRADLRDNTRRAFGIAEIYAGYYDEAAASCAAQADDQTGLCPETLDGVMTCVLLADHPGWRHLSPTGNEWWVGTVGAAAPPIAPAP